MTSSLSRRGALSRAAFALTVLLSLVVLFAPPSDVPGSPPGVDKVVHFTLFGVLALTARWAGVRRTLAGGTLVLYAAVSEVLQGTSLVDRDASVADWCADAVGVLVGLVVWELLSRPRRSTDR